MSAVMRPDWRADAQRAKLLLMFCALGLVAFILNLGVGVWLWHHMRDHRVSPPAYEHFLDEVRQSDPKALAELALTTHAGWEACEETRRDSLATAVHVSVAASFLGLVLFALCFLLAYLLHQSLVHRPGGGSEPLPPDNVDETWR